MSAAEAELRADRVLRRGYAYAGSGNPRAHGAEIVDSATGAASFSFAFFSLGAVIPVLPFLFGVEGFARCWWRPRSPGLALMLTGGTVAVLRRPTAAPARDRCRHRGRRLPAGDGVRRSHRLNPRPGGSRHPSLRVQPDMCWGDFTRCVAAQ
jgi:hypothetical protein